MWSDEKPLHPALYVVGLVAIFACVYVQYFVPLGAVEGYLVVYGIPVAIASLIFGKQILRRAAKNNKEGFRKGLGLFSTFYLGGIFLSVIALTIILLFSPSAEQLLQKPNPALDVPANVAWIMMAVSLLVIGPAEEYLFRGFIYGGMLKLSKGRHWVPLAVLSAILFTSAHGYYALTYGIASPVYIIQLIAFGIGMAFTYRASGGNLVAPSIIHGTNDAIGFLGIATTKSISLAAEGIFVGVGVFVGLYFILIKKARMKPEENQPPQLTPPTTPPAR
jgi:membrane protease YdiL (CAAX protease family)